MRTHLAPWLLLLSAALAAPPARAADAKPSDQTVIIRVAAIDDLIADALYLAEAAGKKAEAETYEKLFRSTVGDDVFKALDAKRPIGLYGKLVDPVQNSAVVLMLPIKDEKAALDLLTKKLGITPTKDGDVYGVALPGASSYFRFANGYAYVTALSAANIDKANLLSPSEVLPPSEVGVASATLNLDQVPEAYKNEALKNLDRFLADALKAKTPGETAVQTKFREAAVAEFGDYARSAINDATLATLRLDVDRKAGDLGLAFTLAAKPKSKFGAAVANLGAGPSVGASLAGPDAAVVYLFNMSLAEKLRKPLEPLIDEILAKALEAESDPAKKALTEKMFKALGPTIKTAALDAGYVLNGPNADGKYTLLGGYRVKDGLAMEKSFKEAFKDLPDLKDKIKLDVDKAGSVNIHRMVQDKPDEILKALTGGGDAYLAFRDDAVILTVGDKALATLKDAVGRKPKEGRILQLEAALGRLAPLASALGGKGYADAAQKAFGDKKGGDVVSFTAEGGKVLKLRWAAKAPVLKFAVLLAESGK
jgi:hypothetical protein